VRTRDEPIETEIDAVVAWRGWSLVEEDGRVLLSSLTRPESWMPRAPHAASCAKGRRPTPQRRCRCGVYATTTPEALGGLRSLPGGVVGEVSLWGRVIEHGQGYRAELGYPGRLGLVCSGCLAEGTGRRADVVQRLDTGDRVRLLPWCSEHAPAALQVPARDVESALLSDYAVDPVSDEMIGRIRSDGPARPAPERSPRRWALVAAIAAATIALASLVLFLPGFGPGFGPGSGAPGTVSAPRRILASAFTGPKVHERSVAPSDEALGRDPLYRILQVAEARVGEMICGRVGAGRIATLDCRAGAANAYVFETAPLGAHRFGACTERTQLVTAQADRILCWRRFAAVQ
jgi:hypothetical protein